MLVYVKASILGQDTCMRLKNPHFSPLINDQLLFPFHVHLQLFRFMIHNFVLESKLSSGDEDNLFRVVAALGDVLEKKTASCSSHKKGIYAISRKKFLFTEKVNFLMIFCLFHCFHQTINKKTLNIATIYFFSEKNNK